MEPMARRVFMAQAEGRWPLCWPEAIARLMRAAGIAGVSRRRSAPITTRQATGDHPASDLVRRNFTAERPNALWVADITFLPTLTGFSLPRCRSRRLLALLSRSEDPRRARRSRHGARGPKARQRSFHHSDRDSQYTSVAFGNRCKEAGGRPSPGSVGNAYNNAMCENFFATLECELIDRRRFSDLTARRGNPSFVPPPFGPWVSFARRIRKET
jgi:putative transposase